MNDKIAVIPFNDVQSEINKLLLEKGVESESISFSDRDLFKSCASNFSKIILPFPSKRENLSFLASESSKASDYFNKGQLLIGGLIDDELKKDFDEAGIDYIDYFTYEPYVIKNAYLTSQGVVRLLLENTKDYIAGKHALITGFGRIGKSLALMLKALGVKVYVAVRSDSQAIDAASLGFDVLRISRLKGVLFYFDYIFNTVPFTLFDEKDISHLKDEALYFEIASKPFGAKEKDFESTGKKFVNASALPGRFYPEAVAKSVFELVISDEKLLKGGKL